MLKQLLTRSYIFLVGLIVVLFAVVGIVGLDPSAGMTSNVFVTMLNSIGLSNTVVSANVWGWTIAWFVLLVLAYGTVVFAPMAFGENFSAGKIKVLTYSACGAVLVIYVVLAIIVCDSPAMFAYTWGRTLVLLALGFGVIIGISALLKIVQILVNFLVSTAKHVILLFVKNPDRREALQDDKVYSRGGLLLKHMLRMGLVVLFFGVSLYVLALKDSFLDFSAVPSILKLPVCSAIVNMFGLSNLGIYADSWNLVIMIVAILTLYYGYSYFKSVAMYNSIAKNKDKTTSGNKLLAIIGDVGVLVLISAVVLGIFALFGLTNALSVDRLLSGSLELLSNATTAMGLWALTFVILITCCFALFWVVYFCIKLLPKIFRRTAIAMARVARDAGEAIVSNSVEHTVASTIVVGEGARVIRKGISIATDNTQPVEQEGDDMGNSRVDNSIFPTLTSMDIELEDYVQQTMTEQDCISLADMTTKFQGYLASQHNMYFDIGVLRAFVAGFGASRLIILEGISGTGKSSLPRLFGQFLGGNTQFVPVQATWRDRIDLLGYYNDFTGTFKETDFLQSLYRANYQTDKMSIAVLDEANLSRMEYYFADFISILEFPTEDWTLNLVNEVRGNKLPAKLTTGDIVIPSNQFFVATANKDDSTYSITERVYDRAVVINFDGRHKKFAVEQDTQPIFWTADYFNQQFEQASSQEANMLTPAEVNKFDKILDFCDSTLDIIIGNRIYTQMAKYVSAFVACGGTKEDALDYILSGKIVRKVAGRFDDNLAGNLTKLTALITRNYKKGTFARTLESIKRIQKKL